MTGLTEPRQAHAQFVDAIFARAPLTRPPVDLAQTPSPPGNLDPARYQREVAAAPQPPPEGDTQADYAWLIEERKRLEAYTHQQLAQVKQQREEFLRYCTQMEEALALKGQNLNRQLKQVATQAEAQEQRARELAEREAFVASHQQQIMAAHQELTRLQNLGRQWQEESEAQRQMLEALRAEAAMLDEAVRFARRELVGYEEALEYRKRSWQEQHEELASRQLHLEDRFRTLEGSEESLRQRLQEVDELEAQVRTELEEREQQLALDHRQAAALREQLRQRLCEAELER